MCAFAQHGEYVGGDISLVPAYEDSKTVYLDQSGNAISDLVTYLHDEQGWNSFRVRLFVNPTNADHDGVVQDLDYVKKLGKRIKDAGATFMLDFHYSDTWVDATHIQSPAAWKSLTTAQKAQKIYDYTCESLTELKNYGATPDFVQVGNEIMYGLCDIKVHPYASSTDDWDGYLSLLDNASKAVRKTCPDAKIVVHTDRPTNSTYTKYYYDKLASANIDYDVIGLSFYPMWHGYLSGDNGLEAALDQLAINFPDKKVQIVETGYNFQYWPTSGVNYNTQSTWACSADGQYKYVSDLISALAKHSNVNGLYYWCPEEAGNGDGANWTTMDGVVINTWLNRGMWWSTSSNGHWPIASGGAPTYTLLKSFLKTNTPSAISNTAADATATDAPAYNLSGQRVSQSYKGIVVKGGKKVVRK